jgi:hypothetical protein
MNPTDNWLDATPLGPDGPGLGRSIEPCHSFYCGVLTWVSSREGLAGRQLPALPPSARLGPLPTRPGISLDFRRDHS